MSSYNLYRIITDEKTLKSIKEIEFGDFGFKERYDIQEWVESNPQILGEDLMIISKDLTFFNDTKERPDLVAIDTNGNVVIIELKRDDSGSNVEWQAIKYASYLSKFTLNDILNLFEKYLTKYYPESEESEQTIHQKILDFIDEDSLDELNKKQRVILASHRFAKEVTSAVNWLIETYLMDIKCVQLIPFHDKDKGAYYIQSNTILPVPGVDELIISASEKKISSSGAVGPVKKNDRITQDCNDIYETLRIKLGVEAPDKRSRWAGIGNKMRYFHMWYSKPYWDNWGMSYRIWFYADHPTYGNGVTVMFECSKKHLLNNGMDESTFVELLKYMKSLSTDLDGQYKTKNETHSIESVLDFDKEKIADKMKQLIQMSTENIEKIIN